MRWWGLAAVSIGLVAVVVLGSRGINSIRAEVEELTTREYQLQQALIASQAADRMGGLLLAARDALADGVRSAERLPTALRAVGATVIEHGPSGEGIGHRHLPIGGGVWRVDDPRMCGLCLEEGRLQVTVSVDDNDLGFRAVVLPSQAVYEAIFAPLAGPHDAYIWAIRADRAIVLAPSPDQLGSKPFAALDGRIGASIEPILASMTAGRSGKGRYLWSDEPNETNEPNGSNGPEERLAAWVPVPGADGLSVAYSANAASVSERAALVEQDAGFLLWTVGGVVSLVALVLVFVAVQMARRDRAVAHRLRADQARLRAALDQSPDLLIETELSTGRITALNHAALSVLGDVAGDCLVELARQDRRASVREAAQAIASGQSVEGLRLTLEAAQSGPIALQASGALISVDGHEAFALWSLRDITRLEAAQARRAQLERLSTLGQLAASIGHEIKNPLAAIVSNAQVAQQILQHGEDPEELPEIVEDLLLATSHIVRIVDALGSVARPHQPACAVRLAEVVATARILAASHLRSCVVELALDESIVVMAPKGAIAQVLTNLLVNAAQAGAQQIELRGTVRAGLVIVDVVDDGEGLDQTVATGLFEPFVSSKGEQGTGLGLAISRDIAERHGGSLCWVSSAVGATFRLSLPIAV